jgi:CopG family nickel-responsive transcriptional regulator
MEKNMTLCISLPKEVLSDLEQFYKSKGYTTRSRAITDALRAFIHEGELEDKKCLAVVAIIYEHTSRGATEALTDLQHHWRGILSSHHFHLDKETCAEIVIISGKTHSVKMLTERIQTVRGVKMVKTLFLPK